MSASTRAAVLAEGARLERERTPGGWRLAVDDEVHDWWADATPKTVIVQQDHNDETFAIAATCDDGIPSIRQEADAAFIAFCGTHMGTLLALVQELEGTVDGLSADYGKLLAESNAYEAEVTRLTARWEALKAWTLNTYADDELTPSGSEKLRTKMAELEADLHTQDTSTSVSLWTPTMEPGDVSIQPDRFRSLWEALKVRLKAAEQTYQCEGFVGAAGAVTKIIDEMLKLEVQ